MKSFIIEGNIVNYEGELYGQVEINPATGMIERVGSALGKADYKFPDCLIFPGFIDVHVHARQDVSGKENYKEDFETLSRAAIHGGVVAVADMPNNPVPPVDEESYLAKTELAKGAAIDVVFYAAIKPGTKPLVQRVPYKAFMGRSVGEVFFDSRKKLEETLRDYAGQSVSFHAEDPEILADHEEEATHELRRPAEAEIRGIEFALYLIEKYKLRGKICHLSTAEGLSQIRAAKGKGVDVTAEVTPHHLYFDESALGQERDLMQVNPPLRLSSDREALIEGLRDGMIDFLASDHAPHTLQEKRKGISGMPHLDTYGAFITWLIKEKGIEARSVARFCGENPGNFLAEFAGNAKYGKIADGFAASFSVLDISRPATIRNEDIKSKCAWSPFAGVTFPGRVAATVVRGKVYKA